MAPKIQDRPLAFAVPGPRRTAILPQTVALGIDVRIRQSNADYFVVSARPSAAPNRIYGQYLVVRRTAETDSTQDGYVVERPVGPGEYQTIARFRPVHLRGALGTAAVNAAADYIERHGHPGKP